MRMLNSFIGRKAVFFFIFIFTVIYVVNQLNNSNNQTLQDSCSLEDINSPLTPQNDPCLVNIIRKNYLHPPSNLPPNLRNPISRNPSFGQSQRILEILNNMRKGFFIEAGALDGESYSNTVYMERMLEWEGLLVEANPVSFAKVVSKHRKAWLVPAALSNYNYPKVVTFHQTRTPDIAQIVETKKAGSDAEIISVQSFPIYSILLALNRTTVDFFSLDVEGFELDVLRTIPWDKVDIKTLAVEYFHVKEGKEAMKTYMEEQGYEVHSEVTVPSGFACDLIFVKN